MGKFLHSQYMYMYIHMQVFVYTCTCTVYVDVHIHVHNYAPVCGHCLLQNLIWAWSQAWPITSSFSYSMEWLVVHPSYYREQTHLHMLHSVVPAHMCMCAIYNHDYVYTCTHCRSTYTVEEWLTEISNLRISCWTVMVSLHS